MEQNNLIVIDKAMLREDANGNLVLPKQPREISVRDYMQAYALCPLDGRYIEIQEELAPYFSDLALTKYRVKVAVEWVIHLIQNVHESATLQSFNFSDVIGKIRSIAEDFSENDYFRTKEIESLTHHDVKAVELLVAEKIADLGLDKLISFVHFGCTSEDVTNPAYGMMIQDALARVWFPTADRLIEKLYQLAKEHATTAMPAHTHGQLATPTTFGKEMAVFFARMHCAYMRIRMDAPTAKCNGATGNYAAAAFAFPDEDWDAIAQRLIVDKLELEFNPLTTQIEGHDYMSNIMDDIRQFNNVLLDFNWDMWSYISRDYLKQLVVASEVGSSTMPQKVNPTKFENSISNVETSNSLAVGLSNKLPVSRMQRDLTDSSSKRNLGMVFGYSLLAIESAIAGLERINVNAEKMKQELQDEWSVLGEAVQTMLRKYGVTDAYDQLKAFTRGKHITKEVMHGFIETLDILSAEDKERLLALTPEMYTGLADKLVQKYI